MPSFKDAYSTPFLNVDRWPDSPTELTVTEAGFDDDRFSNNKGGRIVYLKVAGLEQRLRVNRTNCVALAAMLGDDLNSWPGATITYHRTRGMVRGEQTWMGQMAPVAPKPDKPRSKNVKK